jgi:Carboxypeptidase regulatory-like domain
MSLRKSLFTLLLLTGALLSGTNSYAQLDSGSITGTVTDGSGAVVSGASILLENIATGVKSSTLTNSTGIYVFDSVPVGTYVVHSEHPGFRPYIVQGMEVHVQQTRTINVVFAPASQNQEVIVGASAELLQVEDDRLGR